MQVERRYDPDRHHRRSVRLKGYDYAQSGVYFTTICTEQRDCLSGEVVDGTMRLNPYRAAAAASWNGIPEHFASADVDEFVVMPNHIHGVVLIIPAADVGMGVLGTACRAPTAESFGRPVSHSLATILRSFKSATTKQINEMRATPGTRVWQRNYYERVLRDDRELDAVREYITRNPLNWMDDENHPARQSFAARRL